MENLVTKVSKILDEFVCNRTQLRLYKNEFKHFAFNKACQLPVEVVMEKYIEYQNKESKLLYAMRPVVKALKAIDSEEKKLLVLCYTKDEPLVVLAVSQNKSVRTMSYARAKAAKNFYNKYCLISKEQEEELCR